MSEKSVLVIDPEQEIIDLLALILEDQGIRVVGALSMEEGLRTLRKSRFDAIITEAFDQPDRFDFEAAFLARLMPAAPGTPIILVSVYAATASLRAGDYGLAQVVAKPFEVDALVEKVRKAVDRGLELG